MIRILIIVITVAFAIPTVSSGAEITMIAQCDEPAGPRIDYAPNNHVERLTKWPPDVSEDRVTGARPIFSFYRDGDDEYVSYGNDDLDLKALLEKEGLGGLATADILEMSSTGIKKMLVVQSDEHRIIAIAQWPASWHTFAFYPTIGTVAMTYHSWTSITDGMEVTTFLSKCKYIKQ